MFRRFYTYALIIPLMVLLSEGILSAGRPLRISEEDGSLSLGIADSLIGRRVMLSSVITRSTIHTVPEGQELSLNPVFEIGQRGSSIVLYSVNGPFSERTSTKAVAHVLYQKGREEDYIIVDADALFDQSDESIVDITGLSIGNGAIYDAWYDFRKEILDSVEEFPESVGVKKEATFEVSLADKDSGIDDGERVPFSVEIMTSLTLLPKEVIEPRKADSRIGVRVVELEDFPDDGASTSTRYASRWRLGSGKGIEILIDDRLPESWQRAVSQGVLEWNKAFERIGMPGVISTRVTTLDSAIQDPLKSCIRLGESSDTALAARVLADSSTGEILSCAVMIPGDYLTGIRRMTAFTIADTDKRFKRYDIPEEAVCQILRLQTMSIFCHCLGLQRNQAGSFAYSPENLSDPGFVKAHGITSSISDDALFNLFSSDMETLLQQGLGEYDYYAIEWLYGKYSSWDYKEDPEHLFVTSQIPRTDPRNLQGDLGNDPLAFFDKGVFLLKGAFEDTSFLLEEDVPEEYALQWLQWSWARMMELTTNLSHMVGGCYRNDPRGTSGAFVPVPKSTQKEVLNKIFSTLRDFSWIDSQKDLLQKAGANKDISMMANMNLFSASRLSSRLDAVAFSYKISESDAYSPAEFLCDLQAQMLSSVSKGELSEGEETSIAEYIKWLIGKSALTKRQFGSSNMGSSSFALSSSKADALSENDIPELCYDSLEKAGSSLKKGASLCKDSITRGRILYLAALVDAALDD